MRRVCRTFLGVANLLLPGLLLILGCGQNGGPKGGGTGPTLGTAVGFDPPEMTVAAGEQFSVDVIVENIEDLFGAAFEVTFDGEIVQAVSSSQGDFLESSQIYYDNRDNSGVSIGCTRKAGEGSVSGSGTLATIVFEAKVVGTITLAIERYKLTLEREDESGIKVDVVESGKINVQ